MDKTKQYYVEYKLLWRLALALANSTCNGITALQSNLQAFKLQILNHSIVVVCLWSSRIFNSVYFVLPFSFYRNVYFSSWWKMNMNLLRWNSWKWPGNHITLDLKCQLIYAGYKMNLSLNFLSNKEVSNMSIVIFHCFALSFLAWASGLPKGLGERRFWMGEGWGGRRERKAWHKTIQQIVWHIQGLDVAVIG